MLKAFIQTLINLVLLDLFFVVLETQIYDMKSLMELNFQILRLFSRVLCSFLEKCLFFSFLTTFANLSKLVLFLFNTAVVCM